MARCQVSATELRRKCDESGTRRNANRDRHSESRLEPRSRRTRPARVRPVPGTAVRQPWPKGRGGPKPSPRSARVGAAYAAATSELDGTMTLKVADFPPLIL